MYDYFILTSGKALRFATLSIGKNRNMRISRSPSRMKYVSMPACGVEVGGDYP